MISTEDYATLYKLLSNRAHIRAKVRNKSVTKEDMDEYIHQQQELLKNANRNNNGELIHGN